MNTIQFEELPVWIQELMLDEQELQNNKKDRGIFINNTSSSKEQKGFTFILSRQHYVPWIIAISFGNYSLLEEWAIKNNYEPYLKSKLDLEKKDDQNNYSVSELILLLKEIRSLSEDLKNLLEKKDLNSLKAELEKELLSKMFYSFED